MMTLMKKSIVRKLMSVARDAKEAYSQRPRASISKPSSGTGTPNGASRKSSSVNDEDLDLDFVAEPTSLMGNSAFGKAKCATGADGAAVIQQPLHRAILEHRPSLSASVSPTAIISAHHPSALSRALANTVGRLGRWKRALNPGSRHVGNPGSTVVSAFDLEFNPEGDLHHVHGGMEQYLSAIGTPRVPMSITPPLQPVVTAFYNSLDPLSSSENHQPLPTAYVADVADAKESEPIPPDALPSRNSVTVAEEAAGVAQEALSSMVSLVKTSLREKANSRMSTSSTSSSSSYGMPVAPQSTFHVRRSGQDRSWQLDVVSIDDLDFSDTSSDTSEAPMAQPGLRRLPRRLPLRRDFEFVNRNRESVSSMGFASQDESVASASNSRPSSVVSGVLEAGLGNTIQQWQVNALIDSISEDEDEGDVEDALRRLEGQMNQQKQRAKETKVDNWVRTIRERLAAGDYGDEAPRYLSDEGEDAENEGETGEDIGAPGSAPLSVVSSPSRPGSPASVRRVSSFGLIMDSSTPTPGPGQPPQPLPAPSTSRLAEDKKPAVEDVLPPEILRGRLTAPAPVPTVPVKLPSTPARVRTTGGSHRSWVLAVPTVALAIHFSMIDRELFLAIKFEELVSDDWRSSEAAQAANVLDWGQFLKDRARLKAQGVEGYPTSALVAARARFNLLTNFVVSEIVDTLPSERASVAAKFIRVAWVRGSCLRFCGRPIDVYPFFFCHIKEMLSAEQLQHPRGDRCWPTK
jgi:Gdp/GTP exchange factor required for growth at low temperatures